MLPSLRSFGFHLQQKWPGCPLSSLTALLWPQCHPGLQCGADVVWQIGVVTEGFGRPKRPSNTPLHGVCVCVCVCVSTQDSLTVSHLLRLRPLFLRKVPFTYDRSHDVCVCVIRLDCVKPLQPSILFCCQQSAGTMQGHSHRTVTHTLTHTHTHTHARSVTHTHTHTQESCLRTV